MNITPFIILILFSFILIKSADLVAFSLKRISQRTKISIFALSAAILTLGTSLPELFVGITSALEGVSNLTLGVVLGSNIANITLVVGIAAFATGRVHVQENYLKRDVFIALLAGVAPILLILDHTLSRVDGLVLITIYGVYATSLFKNRFREIAKEASTEGVLHRLLRQVPNLDGKETKEYSRLFIGIALLLFSADVIVKSAEALAVAFDVPVFVIGLIILAVGTSLPELAFSFRSLRAHTPSMLFGNLLGSIIVNSTLVVGIASFISPIQVKAVEEYFIATLSFIIVFLLFWVFIKSKHRLDRWEAGALIVLYALFVLLEFQ